MTRSQGPLLNPPRPDNASFLSNSSYEIVVEPPVRFRLLCHSSCSCPLSIVYSNITRRRPLSRVTCSTRCIGSISQSSACNETHSSNSVSQSRRSTFPDATSSTWIHPSNVYASHCTFYFCCRRRGSAAWICTSEYNKYDDRGHNSLYVECCPQQT